MDQPRALLGLALLVGGAVSARYAHVLARFDEQLDAIGSTRSWDEVEPATWKVTLTLFSAIIVALLGLFVLLSAIF
jgi:hypothetical protein